MCFKCDICNKYYDEQPNWRYVRINIPTEFMGNSTLLVCLECDLLLFKNTSIIVKNIIKICYRFMKSGIIIKKGN